MTVGQLRKQLERFDDKAIVCIQQPLHDYVGRVMAADASYIQRLPVEVEDDGRFKRRIIQDEDDNPFNTDRHTVIVICSL